MYMTKYIYIYIYINMNRYTGTHNDWRTKCRWWLATWPQPNLPQKARPAAPQTDWKTAWEHNNVFLQGEDFLYWRHSLAAGNSRVLYLPRRLHKEPTNKINGTTRTNHSVMECKNKHRNQVQSEDDQLTKRAWDGNLKNVKETQQFKKGIEN